MQNREHRARKRFGQNFLHDQGVIQRIINAIRVKPGEVVLEIGPGLGALTRHLIDDGAKVTAIELDRDLIQHLQSEFPADLRLFNADALTFNYCAEAAEEQIRVVGNLPYNISTPLLFHLFSQRECIRDMHFMLQHEVVQRLAASPGSKIYGRLSVMAQLYAQIEPLFKVYPGSFNPAPKVDSAIVRLTPHQSPPVVVTDYQHFANTVTAAFRQRRKTIRNTLKGMVTEAELTGLNIDPQQRAEQLSLQSFADISNCFSAKSSQ